MENATLLNAVGKLAMAGELAGFSVEQMIELLDNGVSVETLLELILLRLEVRNKPAVSMVASSGWIV